jgi:hypothetical protein
MIASDPAAAALFEKYRYAMPAPGLTLEEIDAVQRYLEAADGKRR